MSICTKDDCNSDKFCEAPKICATLSYFRRIFTEEKAPIKTFKRICQNIKIQYSMFFARYTCRITVLWMLFEQLNHLSTTMHTYEMTKIWTFTVACSLFTVYLPFFAPLCSRYFSCCDQTVARFGVYVKRVICEFVSVFMEKIIGCDVTFQAHSILYTCVRHKLTKNGNYTFLSIISRL